ncbi:UDP-N-acetylglucosamine 2-epimerase (non-hydrolyzing) [Flavobacterium columnare NBRC 100251 = ATCC 23463]|nr:MULTISPECIES: UDP-N-acetylglucosamine 2-epimerase (non-hydrolyzing) [Flavobacterium]AMA49821.1 UDP-N-acetyl glucosamine 2-epimerase [Flavobacterium covae]AMO21175.1 UDP-N-acetylglucosamine 2-epimerase (non-hydrolyzing) [Flavobacterium columnare]AUX19194.1 UDP-N-acetylglucosamine 2-epimerase [Flavobacterium columnare]MCJ1809831.1 UDP-N-acetylglucosamine 2-epimerase (non-hydrolyzing) [Flavobacterium covae]MEB3802217.1 UDP-N-acetylglucosamine 2-epimerase (non-hydrolyzing) [Flavobacterium colum
MMKILICFGTRPEAIKMAPLYHVLKEEAFDVKVCVTAQHRQMLDQVLDFFEIIPDYDLNLMSPNQSLNQLCAKILLHIDPVLDEVKPDLVLVHGDTTTSSIVALAAFHKQIKIGHVEAGLRTFHKYFPFPEELNRQLTAKLADYHFAPTSQSVSNLQRELINPEAVFEVGNTVIDALKWAVNKIKIGYENEAISKLKEQLDPTKKMILVTGHRRENFGKGLVQICEALLTLAKRADVQIVYPVHLNPKVLVPVTSLLEKKENILLIEPAEYPLFIWLMEQSFMIISDSGGIQEEAPTLGKPVLVTRTFTERTEGVKAGISFLVGTNKKLIVEKAIELLDKFQGEVLPVNPYGDGTTSSKILKELQKIENKNKSSFLKE